MGCFVIGFTTIYHIQSHQNPSIIMILALIIPKFTTKKPMKTSLASPWPTPQRLEGRLLPVPLSPEAGYGLGTVRYGTVWIEIDIRAWQMSYFCKHHPAIFLDIISDKYLKVMLKIPKTWHLRIPVTWMGESAAKNCKVRAFLLAESNLKGGKRKQNTPSSSGIGPGRHRWCISKIWQCQPCGHHGHGIKLAGSFWNQPPILDMSVNQGYSMSYMVRFHNRKSSKIPTLWLY